MAITVALSWLSATVAVFGNLLVLISYRRDRSLRELHIYIVYLAVCDFTMGLVIIPLHASEKRWALGATACKIFYVLENFLEDMATLMVILLCMDRLALLRLGAHYSIVETPRRARYKIVLCVCISVLLNVPWRLLWITVQRGHDVCDKAFVIILPVELTFFVLDFLLPFFTITVFNIRIYLAIRQRLIGPASYKRRMTRRMTLKSNMKKSKTVRKVLIFNTPDDTQSLTSRDINKVFCRSSCCCEGADGRFWCTPQPQRVALPRHREASQTKGFLTPFSSFSKVSPESPSCSNIDRVLSTMTAQASKTEIPCTHEQTAQNTIDSKSCGAPAAQLAMASLVENPGVSSLLNDDPTRESQDQEKIPPLPQISNYESPESMPTNRPLSVQGPPLLNDALDGEMAPEAETVERPSRGKQRRTKSPSQGSAITFRGLTVLQYFRLRAKRQQGQQQHRRMLHSKEIRAAYVLIAIVLAMVVFWMPYRLTKLIKSVCDECVSDSTFRFIQWVAWTRSCVNPMLYAANSPAFRTSFAHILRPFLYCLGVRFCYNKST